MNTLSNKSTEIANNQVNTEQIKSQLGTIISAQEMGRIPRQVGWKVRNSDFEFTTLGKTMICYLAETQNCTIQGLLTNYLSNSKDDIQYKPFHNRIREDGAVAFSLKIMNKIAGFLYQNCTHIKGKQCIELIKGFGIEIKDILCTDGSYWNINEAFADKYKGVRTAHKEKVVEDTFEEDGSEVTYKAKCAQIGIQTTYSIGRNAIVNIAITGATAKESDYVPISEMEVNLHLIDGGYCEHKFLIKIDKKGSLFITKAPCNCAAIIKAAYIDGKRIPYIEGEKVSSDKVKEFRKNSTIDMDVEFADGFKARIIRYPGTKKEYAYLLTNIKRNKLKAKIISDIYRLRWQEELLFKDLKSGNNILGVNTTDENILLFFLFGSISAYMIKRLIMDILEKASLNSEISLYKLNVYCNYMPEFVNALFSRNFKRLKEIINKLLKILICYCKSRQSEKKETSDKTMNAVIRNLRKALEDQGHRMDF